LYFVEHAPQRRHRLRIIVHPQIRDAVWVITLHRGEVGIGQNGMRGGHAVGMARMGSPPTSG
jgi:hypothetical protein